MTKLAKPIALFAFLAIAALFIPQPRGSLATIYAAYDMPRLVLTVIGCLLALGGAFAAMRSPRPWQGLVALGGFVLAFVKMRTWELLRALSNVAWPTKLCVIALVGGLIFALLAVVNEERLPKSTSAA